jgi:DNA-binding transcriptional MerR regulator
VVDRLALIIAGRATGFSLAQLHDVLHAAPNEVRARLDEKIGQIDREIAALRSARALLRHALSCEHDSMLECPTFTSGLRAMLPTAVDPRKP